MHNSANPFVRMREYELATDEFNLESQQLLLDLQTSNVPLKSKPSSDSKKPPALTTIDSLKASISTFYKAKSSGPILSYLSWMEAPKSVHQKQFYHNVKDFFFSNTESLEVLNQKAEIFCLLKTPDQGTLLTGCGDHKIYLWDTKTHQQKSELSGHHATVVCLAFSPKDNILISGSYDKMIFLWDFHKMMKICELKEHKEGVVTLAVSSDGELLVSGSDDKSIVVWNYQTRNKLKTLEGHTSAISTVLFTKDNKKIISSSWDSSIRIWDIWTGLTETILGEHEEMIRAMTLSPDYTILASAGGDRVIRIWDLKEKRLIACLEGHIDMVRAMAMTSDGGKLVSAGRDRTIRVWDLKSMTLIRKMKGHRSIVRDLVVSSDDKFIISGSADHTMRVWSIEDLDETCLKGKYENVSALAMSPEGKRLFSGHNAMIVVWDSDTAKVIGKPIKQMDKVLALDVTKKGDRLISAGNDAVIYVWEVESMQLIKSLYGHSSSINSLKCSPDGLSLLSGGSDEYLIKWDLNNYEQYKLHGDHLGPIHCLEISKDNQYILTGTLTGLMILWDYQEFKQVNIFKAHEKTVTSVKIATNNQKLISASLDSKIKIWKTSNGVVLYCLDAHKGPVLSIELNEEGTKLISGSDDGTIRLWDVRLGLPIGIIDIPMNSFNSLILSPDGVRVLAGLNETIQIWEVKQLHILKKLENFSTINAIILTNDENSIVTGGDDTLLRVWDVNSLLQTACLEGHSKPILVIKGFHENDHVVSGSADNTIRIWDLNKNEQLRVLKGSPSLVSSLAIFSDDQNIISGCYDSTVRLWDLKTYNLRYVFKFHEGPVKAVCLTPDNEIYVSGGNDNNINIVNIHERNVIHQLKAHDDSINCLVIIDEGSRIISGSKDKTIKVWDLWTGRLVKILKSHRASVMTLITNANFKKMLSGAEDGTIHIWDLENFKKCDNYDGHEKSVNGLALLSNEFKLISVGSDHSIRIWRLEAVDLLPFLEGHSGPVKQIFLLKDEEKLLSISEDNSLILWDIKENKPFRKYLNKIGEIKCMCMMNDGEDLLLITTKEIKIWDIISWKQKDSILWKDIAEIVVISPDKRCFIGCEDTYIKVWDLEKKELITNLDGHIGAVTAMILSIKRQLLISGSSDNSIIIWDLEKMSIIHIFKGHQHTVSCLLIDKEEKVLISGSYDKSVMIWSLDNYNKLPEIIKDLPLEVHALAFTPDQDKLIIGCGKIKSFSAKKAIISHKNEDHIHIFDLKTLKKIASLDNLRDSSTLSVSLSGETLVSGSKDRSISFWNLSTLSHEKTFSGYSNKVLAELMTSACDKLILACDDKNIVVWNLKFTSLNTILKGHTGNPICLAITHDGNKLVSGAKDKSLRIWSLEKKQEIEILQGHSAGVNCVEFTKDEKILLSGSDDLTIRLWDFLEMKLITVLDGHQSIQAIMDLDNGNRFVTGDKGKNLNIWRKTNEELNYEIEKHINFETGISKIIASPNRKIILVMLENSKIQTWKVKNWSLIAEIEGKKGNLRTTPIFLSSNNNKLIIYFDKIIDCYSGETIFTFQINHKMQSFFYDIKNCFHYFLSTDYRLRKIEKSWLQAYFFNYLNYASIGNLPQDLNIICRQNTCTFPFSLSFLHLISIFDKSEFFTAEILEEIYGTNNVCLSNFYLEDVFGNTPLDIMVLKKNTALIFKFFDSLFKQFAEENCPFYEKVRFLNYHFSKGKNILDLICSLLPLLGTDLRIISKLFEIAFMDIDPKIYDNDILYEELSEPLFIETDEIYTVNKEMILEKLKEKLKMEEKSIYEKASQVKAKFILIPNINDIANKKTSHILEHFSNSESDNEFFSNDVLEMIINYIWNTQTKYYYIAEFIVFFFCFLIYNIIHIFLMPEINTNAELAANQHVDNLLAFFDFFLMLYSLFYLCNEIKQMVSSGFFTYFKNIWNYFDIALIPLLFTSSLFNIMIICNDYEETDYLKLINSICMFCFWFRFLSFFRAIKETSSMMRLIFNVIQSVRYFVLFMVFFMLTLASTFYLLHGESDDATFFQAIFAFYKSTVGDSSGITDYVIVFPPLTYLFMIASTFLFAIILLNLLVAIIGDKHQEISDAEEKTRLYELTNIVVDSNSNLVTKIMRWIRKPKKRGNYLIYLYNESQEKNLEKEKGVEGKMDEYLKIFQRENARLLGEKINEIEKFVEKKFKDS